MDILLIIVGIIFMLNAGIALTNKNYHSAMGWACTTAWVFLYWIKP